MAANPSQTSPLSGHLHDASLHLQDTSNALKLALAEVDKLDATGETQRLEADLRLLREQVADLYLQLQDVRDRRSLDVGADIAGDQ